MSPEESEFLASLFKENFSLLHRYAMTLLHAGKIDSSLIPGLAEDLVQDTFHTASQKIGAVYSHPNPTGWLILTLKNHFKVCQRHYIADSKRLLCIETLPKALPSSYGNPTSVLSSMEYTDVLSKIRSLLSEDEFQVFELVALNRLSHKEAAQRLGITVWASQQRLARARRTLREHLQ